MTASFSISKAILRRSVVQRRPSANIARNSACCRRSSLRMFISGHKSKGHSCLVRSFSNTVFTAVSRMGAPSGDQQASVDAASSLSPSQGTPILLLMKKRSDDHERAPILEALRDYHDKGTIPFSVPGHKSGRAVDAETLRVFGGAAFRYDMQQLGGFDDRTESKEVRQRAEALAARAWGSDVTRFSVNGSSLSAHV